MHTCIGGHYPNNVIDAAIIRVNSLNRVNLINMFPSVGRKREKEIDLELAIQNGPCMGGLIHI